MTTINIGLSQQVAVLPGQVLYVKTTNTSRIHVLYGPSWNTVAQNIKISSDMGAYKFGPFNYLNKVDILALSGRVDYNFSSKIMVALAENRQSIDSDSGAEPIYNSTTSNFTLTITANTITSPTFCQQESTGTITLVAGSGVTFIGSSLATDKAGSLLSILPTSTLNTYIIVKGGL